MYNSNFTVLSILLINVASNAFLIKNDAVKFKEFKLKHAKMYENKNEEEKRFAIFKENLETIRQHNALFQQGLSTYTLGINQFADMTPEEFRATLRCRNVEKSTFDKSTQRFKFSTGDAPASIDWRSHGVVTRVKTQGLCNACWAFAITGTVESAAAIKYGDFVTLSEQQLVDCTTDINNACEGGSMDATFPYLEQYGLEPEDYYRYTGTNGTCKYNETKVEVEVQGHYFVEKDENALLEAVGTVGPVAVAIDADGLQLYSGGIYDGNCSASNLNHAVLLVGYNSLHSVPYWIAKNQWGSSWGEYGYFRILRGENKCGLTEDSVYAIV